MKIAVPVKSNNEIDAHFGHCESYKIFTVSEKNIVLSIENMESPQGCGCKSNIGEVFQQEGVKVMLAGGIGNGAVNTLNANGVEVVRNCNGDATEIVAEYLSGNIKDSGANCSGHEHEHECSNH